jgi:predicted SAM-dependent methyltransferase
MAGIVSKILARFGYTVARTSDLTRYDFSKLTTMYPLKTSEIAVLKDKASPYGIKQQLLESGRTKWLEVGCGGNFEDNFVYIDILDEEAINKPGRYFKIDMTSSEKLPLDRLGKFDLVRLQHVFEHFTPEDAAVVLDNIAYLLKEGGYLLISVPDLEKFIYLYQTKKIKEYYNWALERVEKDAPESFFFSVYAHSILREQHKWCYDEEGLKYIIGKSKQFTDITALKLGDAFSSIPFTHNRPVEDLVVMAKKS